MRSSAPKRRLDVRQQPHSAPGKRAAVRRRSLGRRLLPTPAAAGALALIVAGVGSVAVSSHGEVPSLSASYQTISATYDDGTEGVDISRSSDRVSIAQVSAQADQLQKALSEQNVQVEDYERDLRVNQWVVPVTGYHLTARFGQHSGLWSSGTHTGLDFAGPSGTTIVSAAAGVVKSAGYDGAYGNRTVVTLKDGTDLWYCHQSRITVSPGDAVAPGDVIGYTGATGNVTGPHLHLEVHPDGSESNPVDPYATLLQHNVQP